MTDNNESKNEPTIPVEEEAAAKAAPVQVR